MLLDGGPQGLEQALAGESEAGGAGQHFLREPGAGGFLLLRPPRPRHFLDVCARPLPQLHQSGLLQLPVGLDDGPRVQAEARGELPDGGQRLPGSKLPGRDCGTEPLGELGVERGG